MPAIVTAVVLGQVASVAAGEVMLNVGGLTVNVPIVSRAEMPFQTVVRQQFDYSCGAAAVATLLTYHYDRSTTEREALEAMFARGDQEKIRVEGFSMLDMKDYLDGLGLTADGFRIRLDTFAQEQVPGIALIDLNGYKHFVVLKGIVGDQVLVGDPALGVKAYPREEFEQMWNEILLVITADMEQAQQHFNQVADWRLRPNAPMWAALDRGSLGAFSMGMPGRVMPIRPVIHLGDFQ
ncbi:MAG: C39 family peptidase [Alphaproteobacteria bacterium]